MLAAPIPADEAQRLDDLRRLRVLDTAPEDRFDRITRSARRVFGVPIALVSLVDADRQWFKSRQGLDAAQTPRNVSFCGHAVLREGPFIVPDARTDPRFADNPLVTGPPHVRFYAGMPLHGLEGHRVGTLCLLDTQARSFGPNDIESLGDLAAWAERELNFYSIREATDLARDREERLQAVLDNAGDAIVTLTADGRIESSNPAAARMFGGSRAGSVGVSVAEWIEPSARAELFTFFRDAAARSDTGVRREVQCRRADGSGFPAEVTVTRMGAAAGGRYTLMLRDVSERKQVEKMKNEFISTVSHELRTPLTSVRGSLGLVLGGAVGAIAPQARGLLDIAASNCDRLVRLVNDMLDVEKIESGNVRFEVAAQQLAPLVQQAIAATEAFAQGLGVGIALDAGPGPLLVLADRDRLTQVVVNLLSNAAKFSPRGGTVDVRLGPAGAGRVRIGVADRGPGIPPEFRPRLFSRFGQADASDARARAGTGLGLAISKAIVERLGGRIGFEDRAGGGTEFTVVLPAQAAPAPAGVPVIGRLARPIDESRLRASLRRAMRPRSQRPVVLHVEDDADLAQVVRVMVGETADAVHAPTLAQARRLLQERSFDLVLLDMQLPDGDGSELLAMLPALNAATPVVIFSAGEVAADTAAQVRDALVKSRTSSAQLVALLQRLMGVDPGTTEQA